MKISNTYRIYQWGYGKGAEKLPMYIFTIPAFEIATKAEIYRRTPQRKNGYQRELSSTRLGKGKLGVVGYILKQMGVFPTSVLVNVRKEEAAVEFIEKKKINENISLGDLIVPDDVKWYIVDGQHRIEGLKIAMREKPDLASYPVIVTMTNEDIFYEMLIFYIVNSRAKSVPTDLSYRILQRMYYDIKAPKWIEETIILGADRRKAVAATIVDYLNSIEGSPFKGRIQEVGEPSKPEHIVKDGTLTRYIAEILKVKIFQEMYDRDVADLLIRYWSVIKELYPACFEKPKEYVLLDTFGLSSLSKLFPTIYGYCSKDGDLSKENMKKYLSYLKVKTPEHSDPDFKDPITEKWWHKTDGPGIIHGTGEGHYRLVALKFAEKIRIVVSKEREKCLRSK